VELITARKKERAAVKMVKTAALSNCANTITTTDENGNQMLYRYTPLGQIQQVTDLTTGTVLKSMAYDHLNRPATETAYSPEGIRNTTEFTYDRYSRTLTTKKKDAGGIVISEESAAYNSTTTRETKTIAGDENAPSIITTVYKDKLRLVVDGLISQIKATSENVQIEWKI